MIPTLLEWHSGGQMCEVQQVENNQHRLKVMPMILWLTGSKRKVVVSVGELEVPKGECNRQLVKDYYSWF